METKAKTAAAAVVARLQAAGWNSRSLEEALAAPRPWGDTYPVIAQGGELIVELWHGPEGDKLVKFEDHSYLYFFGCTGGAKHFDTPMVLAFAMPGIAKEEAQWKLVFTHDRHEHGGTIHFYGSSREKPSASPPSNHFDARDDADEIVQTCMRCGAMDGARSLLVTTHGQYVCCGCFDAPDDCIDDDERRAMGYNPCPRCGTWVSEDSPEPICCANCGTRMSSDSA